MFQIFLLELLWALNFALHSKFGAVGNASIVIATEALQNWTPLEIKISTKLISRFIYLLNIYFNHSKCIHVLLSFPTHVISSLFDVSHAWRHSHISKAAARLWETAAPQWHFFVWLQPEGKKKKIREKTQTSGSLRGDERKVDELKKKKRKKLLKLKMIVWRCQENTLSLRTLADLFLSTSVPRLELIPFERPTSCAVPRSNAIQVGHVSVVVFDFTRSLIQLLSSLKRIKKLTKENYTFWDLITWVGDHRMCLKSARWVPQVDSVQVTLYARQQFYKFQLVKRYDAPSKLTNICK